MKRFSLLIIFIIISNSLSGYNLRRISKYDGLSNSAIQALCQDSDGFLWFGSVDGLNIYDGREVSIYRPAGGESLSGNLVEDIIEASPGVFWIQTNYGLNRLDKRRRTVERFDMYSSNYRLRKGGDVQLLFVRENNEIVYYNEASTSFATLPLPDIEYADLLDYLVTDDNTLWLFCRGEKSAAWSLVRDEEGNLTLAPAPFVDHPHGFRYAFHEDRAVYFVDTTGTLYEYHTVEKKKYYIADIGREIARDGDISSIVKCGSDFFIGFKTNGLICLRNTPERAQFYETEQIDINAGVFCLLRDRSQDIVWIGTDGQGVYIYSNDSYSVKSTVLENLTHGIGKPVRALLLDGNNSLWIATKGDGLLRLGNYDFNRSASLHRIDHFDTRNSRLSDNQVYSLSRGKNDILWIGNESGLDYYDYATRSIYPLDVRIDGEEPGALRYVHGVVQLDPGTLWVATVGTGMVRIDLEWGGSNGQTPYAVSAERFTIGDGSMPANYFFTVYAEDSGDEIWFGNRGYGAYRGNPSSGGFEAVLFADNDTDHSLNDIFCIMEGEEGEMWFGTGGGLVKRKPDGEYTVYNERSGFPNSTIHGMLKSKSGNIWLGTNFGIIRFNPSTETFATYSNNTPTDVIEFSDGAFFRSGGEGGDDEMLFFGGINGFVAIRENEYTRPGYIPPIVMNRLTIFGKEENIYDHLSKENGDGEGGIPVISLNYRENFFSLSPVAIDYIDGHNYTYLYRLEGINDTWIDNGPNNTVYFTNVAPGHYTLRLKCLNREAGIESGEYAVRIRIRPPWYMSIWAYMIYGLLAAGILWLAVSFVVKRNELRRKTIIDDMREKHQKEVYESKLRFFTNIAHEFCTPLTLIQGPCDRILSHDGSDPFVRRYAGLIQRNADRMNDLIQDLIEFRRIETGNKTPRIEPLDMSGLAASLFDNFTDLAESREFSFTGDISPGITWNTDRDFMTTIINNLISNAFKYTNRKGAIRVALSVDGGELKFAISNTGKGIRAENIERLFDRYSILDDFEHRNDKSQTRNGLGLAISYNMIQLLGGRIDVDSERGVETRFTMYLPTAEPTPADPEKGAVIEGSLPGAAPALPSLLPQLPSPPAKDYSVEAEIPHYLFDERKPTVMIIDDDRDMLWFICEIFAQEYNVIPVNRPLKVDELLDEMLPDVIICDVMMPGIGGIALTRRIKANPRMAHVPFILVSAKHHVDEQIEGLEAGADLYVTKPFNVDYLRIFVRHLISRKETLKEYFASPISAYELSGGKLTHVDHRRFVQQVLDVINANIANKALSAQFIAERMNLSTRHLYRKINEAGAESPLHMIRDCRLHIACELLQNTTMTIDEIIYKSGFSNRGSFFNAFSEKFECTPREFREHHIKGL